MICRKIRNSLSAHLDGLLAEAESRAVVLHLNRCRDCSAVSAQMQAARRALQNLPPVRPPETLTANLRVIASRERVRREIHRTPYTLLAYYVGLFRLRLDNLMTPLALPFAGGLASAIILFGMLFPTFALRAVHGVNDVPIALYTPASITRIAPFAIGDDDLIVEVSIDEQGRMVDYTVANDGSALNNEEVRRGIENSLLFTQFTPATQFGQPTQSKIYVSFTRNQINVKS